MRAWSQQSAGPLVSNLAVLVLAGNSDVVCNCDPTTAELQRGVDLVRLLYTGHRPIGDLVLGRILMASLWVGRRVTERQHPNFGAPACH